ncbi:cytochrome b/b6 domain-containing protein [Microbacterium sp. K27]|uniref:cytochrome b/b6 domain-containing protein n=1 Tax=Microbacterium sp. K27 TaxID=2305445 RepID=UPI00197B38CD|nr:cytochrome b/b6 domain-containing protein [Microbacterium sp. K27]
MATRMLRRGLPRVPGGEPWPPADAAAVEEPAVAVATEAPTSTEVEPAAASDAVPADRESVIAVDQAAVATAAPTGSPAPAATAGAARIRRGLPRVPGGEPWPPSVAVAPAAAVATPAPQTTQPVSAVATAVPASSATGSAPATARASTAATTAPPTAPSPAVSAPEAPIAAAGGVRRGLPRVVGGEPWPAADTVPLAPAVAASVEPVAPAPVAPESTGPESTGPESTPVVAAPVTAPAIADVATPLPWTRTVWNGRAPRRIAEAPAAATGRRRPTWPQAIAVLFGAAALGVLAGAAIAFVRALLSFPFMQDFLAAFPGEYEPGIAVEPGFSPWVGWQHFFNMFLMVLIIRSGLQVRTEKRPTVFWTPRGNAKGKISLNLWFHQSLDILWLVNGVIFVVLLFVTGHWVRIVPTSWEVFPNALSAALQYVSFDWPHENGWNNYNSLQQLAYFATVFIAAPLAAITGFRMSGLWPKKAEKLSKAYPVEWARALHFPIMLYFVAFIIAHVALVMLTGFLRNLNHMFASQDAVTWTGFWVFILSLVVIAIGWVAARPLVLAPIAKAFGKVSGR